MAGKPRQGIDYAGWSVDIFDNDTKIDKLLESKGWIGFSVYFYLCMRAFGSNGYFYKWCYDDCATTARKMGSGISAGTVHETVGYCLQIGLFDKGLFDGWGVLTSRGIQRSFWAVLKMRRSKRVFKELWLLEQHECEGLVFVPLKSEMSVTNGYLQVTNDHLQETNAPVVKESKVKDKNNMCKADALALFERLWKLYPVKKGKGKISDAQKMKIARIGYEEMARAIERYKQYVDSIDYLPYQNGSTFFNSGYVDYLDANYEPGKQTSYRKQNGFNRFQQNQYDFNQLEQELMSN